MNIAKAMDTPKMHHIAKTLRYSLYVITHPLDGFWDLTHEKRGSVEAANIIIFLVLLTRILKIQFTSFLFMKVQWEYVNIFEEVLGILIPLIIGCIANWSLTTLFDGKGTMKDIYIAIAYSLVPYVIIQLPMTFISNLLISGEGAFYTYLNTFSVIWCVVLLMSAVMMIHDFTLSKALIAIAATLLGMLVILFLLLLFFSLISDGLAYFISLYKELILRFY